MNRDPDLQIAHLQIWVLDRQFPESDDYWDGNWLLVSATCETGTSRVSAEGPILHLSELDSFREGCNRLAESLSGESALACMEPNLHASLSFSDRLGNIAAAISITPDDLIETHEFRFDIDQSHLPYILRGLNSILEKYPIRSKP